MDFIRDLQLTEHNCMLSHLNAYLVKDITNPLSRNWKAKLSHAHKDINKAIDCLASLGLKASEGLNVAFSTICNCLPYFLEDLNPLNSYFLPIS